MPEQQQKPPIERECPRCYQFSAEEREGLMTRHRDRWNPRRGHWTEPADWFRVKFYVCDNCGTLRPHEKESISEAEYEALSDELPEMF